MKRIVFFLFGFFLFGELAAQGEKLEEFHSIISIDPSGQITVLEKFRYATEISGKRGIIRSLPIDRFDKQDRKVKNDYSILSVKRDGIKSKYRTERENGHLAIYVGESSVFLEPGVYDYEITYSVPDQIRFFEGYDELYWNVNGTQWAFPVLKTIAEIRLPRGAETIQMACYTGQYGSSEQNCEFSERGSTVTFSAGPFSSGENLSIAVGFSKGVVAPPPPPTEFQRVGFQVITGLIGLVLLGYYFFTWLNYGIDPPKPTVIPLFDPPAGLSPASVGMLSKGYFWQDFITASVVSLAAKRYLRIEENTKSTLFGLFKQKEFDLIREKLPDDSLPKEENQLLTSLFGKGSRITLDGKYNSKVADAVQKFQSSLNAQWNPLIYKGFNVKFWILPILIIIGYIILLVKMEDYFVFEGKAPLLVGFIGGNIILFFIYQWLIRKPAKEKLKLRAEIEGFKMYMAAAEEKMLQFSNPPELTPEKFEALLPYAMVLDVDEIWGEKFQKMISLSSTAQQYHPTWYSGGMIQHAAFAHMLNSSLSNTISQSSNSPSSGGSSGSGGGGFSGGGGGGGGGGSW
ncbi:DUF2207 domain-containing protein [Algoriphagus sp.]|uniref:DUF2207 domain-containing protein n=1 Tax=Algoriphagus sp. TaxID=1872435 RepID=UPI00391A7A88